MKPEVRVFTTANPCTKKDIWLCFAPEGKFIDVGVVVAHSVIGKNVPRVMERNGYLIKIRTPREDLYRLTGSGKSWLKAGILSYIRNHPSESEDVVIKEEKPTVARKIRRGKPL